MVKGKLNVVLQLQQNEQLTVDELIQKLERYEQNGLTHLTLQYNYVNEELVPNFQVYTKKTKKRGTV